MYRLLKGISKTIAILGAVTTLAIIPNAQAQEKAASEDLLSINVAWLPDPTVPTIFLARDRGYFDDAKLDVNWVKLQSGPATFSVLQGGSADIASMGLGPAIIAKAQGLNIQILATSVDVSRTNVLVTTQPLHNIRDLKGLRIASVKGATPYYGLSKSLTDAGLSMGDIQFVDLAPGGIVPAFSNKDIDGAWVWSPWQNHLLAAGGHAFTSNADVGAPSPNVWVVRTEFLENNLDAVARFMKGIDQGIAATIKYPDAAAQILADQMQIDLEVANTVLAGCDYYTLAQQIGAEQYLSLTAAADAEVTSLRKAAFDVGKFFVDLGQIPAAFTVDNLINSDVAKSVANQ